MDFAEALDKAGSEMQEVTDFWGHTGFWWECPRCGHESKVGGILELKAIDKANEKSRVASYERQKVDGEKG